MTLYYTNNLVIYTYKTLVTDQAPMSYCGISGTFIGQVHLFHLSIISNEFEIHYDGVIDELSKSTMEVVIFVSKYIKYFKY